MDHSVNYRLMKAGEEGQVIDLVTRVFHQFVAPLFNDEGVTEFIKYTTPHALAERIIDDHFVLIAESKGNIIGIIEIRKNCHIALFFVRQEHQRKGIGKDLLSRAVRACIAARPDLAELTVNASPNAVAAYQSLGFIQRDEEKTVNGIRFVPMSLEIDMLDRQ